MTISHARTQMQTRRRSCAAGRPMRPALVGLAACAAFATASLFGGCAVVEVAGAAAGAAITVTGTVVATGVSVAGKVVEKTVDAVTPSSGGR